MIRQILATSLLTLVVCSNPAPADSRRTVGIEVSFGTTFENTLGVDATASTIEAAQKEISEALDDTIKYFDFEPASDSIEHKLLFLIDHPSVENPELLDNIHDYYVFVRLIAAEQTLGDKLIWEFTRASDNIDGLAEPKQVAGKLGQQVNQRYEKIITELLHQLSFTESATFFSNGIHGWVLDHPRIGLCMKWDSKLRVRSVVPVHLFQRDFTAQVMQHPNDEATTFSLTEDDVSLLATDPAEATVTAVHVVSYTRECPSADAVTTSPPEEDLFAAGGQQ